MILRAAATASLGLTGLYLLAWRVAVSVDREDQQGTSCSSPRRRDTDADARPDRGVKGPERGVAPRHSPAFITRDSAQLAERALQTDCRTTTPVMPAVAHSGGVSV